MRRIEAGLGGDPFEQAANVLDRILAFASVVERQEGLAEAARAAHVRPDHRDPEFIDKVVVAAQETQPGLCLRAAVDVDQDRTFAAKTLRIRTRDQPRYTLSVKTVPAEDLGCAEAGGIDSSRIRAGPRRGAACRKVDHAYRRWTG